MILIQRFSSEEVCSFIPAGSPVASLEFTFDLFELLEQVALLCNEQFWNNQRCRERAHARSQARSGRATVPETRPPRHRRQPWAIFPVSTCDAECRVYSERGIEKKGKRRQFRTLGFHSLRHTFVSELANASVPADVRRQIRATMTKKITNVTRTWTWKRSVAHYRAYAPSPSL